MKTVIWTSPVALSVPRPHCVYLILHNIRGNPLWWPLSSFRHCKSNIFQLAKSSSQNCKIHFFKVTAKALRGVFLSRESYNPENTEICGRFPRNVCKSSN